MFHSYGDVTINGEGLQILTYTQHSMSRKGSLAWHTYCDAEHSHVMVISEDPWHSHFCGSFACFNDLGLSRQWFEQPTIRMRGDRSNQMQHRRGFFGKWKFRLYLCGLNIVNLIFIHLQINKNKFQSSAIGGSVMSSRRWQLYTDVPSHSRCGTLKNPNCSMAMSTEVKFATHQR